MTGRRQLPNRRQSEALTFEHDAVAWRASFSRFPDGSLGEVFLDMPRIGSAAGAVADESAIAASLALQFGCAEVDLAHALPKLAGGEPAGPLGVALKLIRGANDVRS